MIRLTVKRMDNSPCAGKMTYPVLYPMGMLTFSIACATCVRDRDLREEPCFSCICERRSAWEPHQNLKITKEETDAENN